MARKKITNVTDRVMLFRYASISLLSLSFVTLVGLEIEPLGWILLLLSLGFLKINDIEYRKYLLLIHLSVVAIGLAPVGTKTDLLSAFYMGLGLLLAVLIPFLTVKYLYRSEDIRFPSLKEKNWTKNRFLYLFLTAFLGWLLIPIMLRSQSIYLNWELEPGFWNLFEAYIGLNLVGIWDEIFFILILLAVFQKFFPFTKANLLQAIFFTAFLYAVGFENWSIVVIYLFAILQGYIFRRTKSLLFILAIHLTVDLVLHLALVHLIFPESFPYFIT